MKQYIKYMVSLRCKMIVKEKLEKLGILFSVSDFGTTLILENCTQDQQQQLKTTLARWGLELLEAESNSLVEKIENTIVEMIQNSGELEIDYNDRLREKFSHDYDHLSDLFAEVNGISIEQFITILKTEKVKELLLYYDLSLSEISHKLHYRSPEDLSYQFKKATGLTPAYFRQLKRVRSRLSHEYERVI